MLRDEAGNIDSTTETGGGTSCNQGYGCGTVFKLDVFGAEVRAAPTGRGGRPVTSKRVEEISQPGPVVPLVELPTGRIMLDVESRVARRSKRKSWSIALRGKPHDTSVVKHWD